LARHYSFRLANARRDPAQMVNLKAVLFGQVLQRALQALTRCQRIICEIEAAETELALANVEPRGRLRVSMPMVLVIAFP
jgi:hypothetical protein